MGQQIIAAAVHVAARAGRDGRRADPAGRDTGHAACCVPGDRRRPGWVPGCCCSARNKPPSSPRHRPSPWATAKPSWDDLQPVDLLGLELGYRLIALVDKNRQGDLLTRIKGVRRKLREVGFLAAAGACARQPRTEAQRLPRAAARGVVVGGRGPSRHVPGHQPRWHLPRR